MELLNHRIAISLDEIRNLKIKIRRRIEITEDQEMGKFLFEIYDDLLLTELRLDRVHAKPTSNHLIYTGK